MREIGEKLFSLQRGSLLIPLTFQAFDEFPCELTQCSWAMHTTRDHKVMGSTPLSVKPWRLPKVGGQYGAGRQRLGVDGTGACGMRDVCRDVICGRGWMAQIGQVVLCAGTEAVPRVHTYARVHAHPLRISAVLSRSATIVDASQSLTIAGFPVPPTSSDVSPSSFSGVTPTIPPPELVFRMPQAASGTHVLGLSVSGHQMCCQSGFCRLQRGVRWRVLVVVTKRLVGRWGRAHVVGAEGSVHAEGAWRPLPSGAWGKGAYPASSAPQHHSVTIGNRQ